MTPYVYLSSLLSPPLPLPISSLSPSSLSLLPLPSLLPLHSLSISLSLVIGIRIVKTVFYVLNFTLHRRRLKFDVEYTRDFVEFP